MRFGYWTPIFGGWLRNVEDEDMTIAWPYGLMLLQFSPQHQEMARFGRDVIARYPRTGS